MALFLPPAKSINRFTGGYKSVSDFTDLSDTETNDSQNTLYGPDGDVKQRLGSQKLLNVALTGSTSTTTRPITGHYYYQKLGATTGVQVVTAGDSIFTYTSATASTIRTTLTNNSETYFQFTQIQDPRSASDDIMLATNGVDPIQVWNGSASAVLLNSFTSASSVPIGKYMISHKRRIYVANIVDATDVDSPARFDVSSFGSDGAPDPHRFKDTIYAGGSDGDGEITGFRVINNQIAVYKRGSTWKFSPGSGNLLDTGSLQQVEESLGVFAPFSLVDFGNFHVFLSERGVYAFNGVSFVHLSEKVDDILLNDSNLSQLNKAKGVRDKKNNQYKLYFASSGSNRNDTCLTYDLRPTMKVWLPPVVGRQVNYLSIFINGSNQEQIIYGDYLGYLYKDGVGKNDGIETGYNAVATTGTINTITATSATSFPTTNDGLRGLGVAITGGTGVGQTNRITSNTSSTLTLESEWGTLADTTTQFAVGAIDSHWRSKDYDFGAHDLTKIFRHIRLRVAEEGNKNLILYYIVNFKSLQSATKKLVSLLGPGFVWGTSKWGRARWGARATIIQKVSLRNTTFQRLMGTHFAVRFASNRANDKWSVSGFDMELKAIGKR